MENVLKKINLIQHEIGKISKNAQNPFYNSTYADLSNIQDSLQAYLDANKLMVFNRVESSELITTIHDMESGESLSSSISLSMTDPQKKGSEITYFRRYNLVALFDLKIEDDDANSTAKKPNNSTDQVKVNVWLSDKEFDATEKATKEQIRAVLKKYDCKTKQPDDKVYGMKKQFRTELEKLI